MRRPWFRREASSNMRPPFGRQRLLKSLKSPSLSYKLSAWLPIGPILLNGSLLRLLRIPLLALRGHRDSRSLGSQRRHQRLLNPGGPSFTRNPRSGSRHWAVAREGLKRKAKGDTRWVSKLLHSKSFKYLQNCQILPIASNSHLLPIIDPVGGFFT